eukprot:gnl/TRDRNA2_/TRDRNA2_51110_c0_seq1.p1 gnl/TRDRNA2_/TRDRNA2_51110_c0~~gnl/TRDRNA2_/TRDRNA2_51110_c0_seq1.p1  ORF type:complete len:224 (-),score=29.13 gnl/TRDRNA2_/TRDRNA2_51110_c0_seq1:174-845(-)
MASINFDQGSMVSGEKFMQEPAYVSVPGLQKSSEPAYVTLSRPAAKPIASPQYQVLLCGLPEEMTHPVVVRAMMEQAKLTDGIACVNTFVNDRGSSCDKVLVTFCNSTWAKKCIQYFNGRWANAGLVVSAIIVGIVPITTTSSPEMKSRTLSADAPPFVLPTSVPMSPMSVKASKVSLDVALGPVSEPKEPNERVRVHSDTSTEGGPGSDEASEESDSSTLGA